MQMERCANAWEKGRPGSQAVKKLRERTQRSTLSGAWTSPASTHPHSLSQGILSQGCKVWEASYSLSVPTLTPASVLMIESVGLPALDLNSASWLLGSTGKVWNKRLRCVCVGGGCSHHRWRSLHTSDFLSGKDNGTHRVSFHLCLILARGPDLRPQCSCQ